MKSQQIKDAAKLMESLESLREMLAYDNMPDVEAGQIQFIEEICDAGHTSHAGARLPVGLTIRLANMAVGLIEKELKELGVDMPAIKIKVPKSS